MERSIVLLRGVNVGGHNRVPMGALRDALGEAGYTDVNTYIQSGNIGLSAPEPVAGAAISALLTREFSVDVPVVVVRPADVRAVLDENPLTGSGIDATKVIVYFMGGRLGIEGEPLDPERYLPDSYEVTDRAVYVHYAGGAARSKLTIAAIERAVGRVVTGRNLRTTERLVDL